MERPPPHVFAGGGPYGVRMSVDKSKRGESACEYLDQAVKVAWLVGGIVGRLPVRWKDNRSRYLLDCCERVMEHCAAANAVFPHDAEDARIVRSHLVEAKAQCSVLQVLLTQVARSNPERPRYERDSDGRKVFDANGQPVQVGMVPAVSDGRMTEVAIEVNRLFGLIVGKLKYEESRW